MKRPRLNQPIFDGQYIENKPLERIFLLKEEGEVK